MRTLVSRAWQICCTIIPAKLNTLRSPKTRCTFSLPLELLTGAIFLVADILLADSELRAVPLHLTSVGRKGDPAARALFAAALKQPVTYKRVEWWDRSEGALPNSDVQYPELEQAAAFLCTDRSCSPPIFSPDKISTLAGLPPES